MSETFGQRLRRLRVEHGYSLSAVGARCGVSNVNVCKWEKDVYTPNLSRLSALSAILETTADYLLTGSVPPHRPVARDIITPALSSNLTFAALLDHQIIDLERRVATARAMRGALA